MQIRIRVLFTTGRANLTVGILEDLKDINVARMLIDEAHQGMIIPDG
jgi:hypothetical protein